MVTALRGFALVPLLAPTSVAVAILTRELPGLSWSTLLPFGLLAVSKAYAVFMAVTAALATALEGRRDP